MWTKQQIIEAAFEELALAGYVYDLDPEQLQGALRRLDSMMAEWDANGIAIGYLLPSTPDDSSLGDDAGIPDAANQAVFLNLAIALAPGRGKNLAAETKLAAKRGYDRLLGDAVRAAARQSPMPNTLPRGAGNKPWRSGAPFFPTPPDTLDTDGGDSLTV